MHASVRVIVSGQEHRTSVAILAEATGLSKLRVKGAMQKGAVWLKRTGRGERRLRRAQTVPRPGDVLSIHYDEELLARVPPTAERQHDAGRFSIWFKPVGLMTQGNRFGDHCSLLRQAEVFLRPERQAFLVHRLDREASGLVIIAHDRAAAGALSRIFADRRVVKRYRIEVRGQIGPESAEGRIDLPLEGKMAVTEYTVFKYDSKRDVSTLNVVTRTGRRHQIRRHFELIGFPVMGDPSYGADNHDAAGLKLIAWGLEFTSPFTGEMMKFQMAGF